MKIILIIENGKALSNMIRQLFQNEECRIILSENFLLNGSKLPKQIPNLVIADLTSIKKEKVELLMDLKNNPVISLVPFLLITSNHDPEETTNQFSMVNYYLNKPYTKDELSSRVQNILSHTNMISPW